MSGTRRVVMTLALALGTLLPLSVAAPADAAT